MSIQSSINSMLATLTTPALYKGISKRISGVESEIKNVGSNVEGVKEAIKTREGAPTEVTGAPALPQAPTEATGDYVLEDNQYVDKTRSPETEKQIDYMIDKFGGVKSLRDAAESGDEYRNLLNMTADQVPPDARVPDYEGWEQITPIISSVSQSRVTYQQAQAQQTKDAVRERLEQAKSQRAKIKQSTRDFVERKQGGKHRK